MNRLQKSVSCPEHLETSRTQENLDQETEYNVFSNFLFLMYTKYLSSLLLKKRGQIPL